MRSIALSQEEIDNLIKEVHQRNLQKTSPNKYELLRVKDKDIFLVLYETGKMVFQESEGMKNILNEILVRKKYTVIGTDEAGKGEWYGPLVVAGVTLQPEETIELRKVGVGDSKALSSFRIYEIGSVLKASRIEKEIKILSPHIYNKVYEDFKRESKTLNDLLLWAHAEVIRTLLSRIQSEKVKIVVDRFDSSKTEKGFEDIGRAGIEIIQKTKGESEPAVAAASVLAKFIFEEEVRRLNEKFQVDLRNTTPDTIPRDILPLVAKLHYRNVKRVI